MPYKLLASYRKNYGHFLNKNDRKFEYYPPDDPRGRYIIPSEIVSTKFEINILQHWVDLNLIFAADFTENNKNFGVGFHLNKSL